MPAGKLQEMNENFFCILKVTEEGVGFELDPDPDPDLLVRGTDPLVRGTDPRITEMSRNPHTAFQCR